MDNQRSPLLNLSYLCNGKSMEELKQSLIYTKLELEQTRAAVQEELRKRDDQLLNLKELVNKVTRERDEAQEKCQRLVLEKFVFQNQKLQNPLPVSGISSIEDEPEPEPKNFSSSDCEESIVSSPVVIDHFPQPRLIPCMNDLMAPDKPLPEKGKLLQAVMKAGPLLQTLLVAGPLPQWRHPPPPLQSFEIPPVTVPPPPPPPQPLLRESSKPTNCGKVSRKRVFCESSDSPTDTNKYQRIVLH